MTTTNRVAVVVGNPRPGSRTARAAVRLAELLAEPLGAAQLDVLELAGLGPELHAAEHPRADAALETLAGAALVVVATPVHKGSFTGLLKSFLDLFPGGALRGTVAVPLVVSASPAHSAAGEVHLRPVLLELGAAVPAPALALLESRLESLEEVLGAWVAQHLAVVRAALPAGVLA